MDWKYILSLTPEELSEDTKDELLNTISWYDLTNNNDLDLGKSVALLRISQEIMKFKSEQVTTLLAELDDIAMKQGEEEVRKQDSEYDSRSGRSKKSTSIDIDHLEEKYRDEKLKYKKQYKINEKNMKEIEKFKKQIKMLEQERVYLQNELQNATHDENSSDISETIKDQHKHLIDCIHQKNGQITQLLKDIENTESDNIVLRERLTTLRDQLSDATEQLELLSKENKDSKMKLEQITELMDSLKQENEGLRNEIFDIVEDKKQRDAELDEFTQEIDAKIDDWKRILTDKNLEIDKLKSKLSDLPDTKSLSSENSIADTSQLNALYKVLSDREHQILELQTQLQNATKEMEDTTQILEELTKERDTQTKSLNKMKEIAKESKKQLKGSNNRCQELQENIKYQESLVEMKNNDIKDFVNQLKEGDFMELSEAVELIEELKTQKKLKEKQLSDLVRSCNKLQTVSDCFEKENNALRDRLGLSDDDFVSTRNIQSQQRKQKKVVNEMKKQIQQVEDDKLQLRLDAQKLNKVISSLSNQIIHFGETPNTEIEGPNIDLVKDLEQNDNLMQKEVDERDMKVSKDEYVAVIDENDALRKGLHEILDSIHLKQESSIKQIKSDTLDKLLKALDQKHIAGWYHPAMRLQAEIHSLEGSNNELREQLRLTKEELQQYKDSIPSTFLQFDEINNVEYVEDNKSNSAVIAKINQHLLNVLKNYKIEEETNSKLIDKLEKYKIEFIIIQEQVCLLYKQYTEENELWIDKLEEANKLKTELEEKQLALEEKLNLITLFTNPETDEEKKIKKAAEMASELIILNRKCLYLENQENNYLKQVAKIRNDILNVEKATITKINQLNEEKKLLLNKIDIFEQQNASISIQEHIKVQNNLDNLQVKHRALLKSVLFKSYENELNAQVELLMNEKNELQDRLVDATSQLKIVNISINPQENVETMAKSLAQSEINEITERQRADHINNLYQLVKDQLQKSEDRYKEYQKYNNDTLHRNLILQENVKDLEDKIINHIDINVFESLENEHKKLLQAQEELIIENNKLTTELKIVKSTFENHKMWSNFEEYEFLNLRHQIVDLQSIGDDKAVIARLSSDVVVARMSEVEYRKKFEDANHEVFTWQTETDKLEKAVLAQKNRVGLEYQAMKRKCENLQLIIHQQRERYYGFIPIISETKFIANMQQVFLDKQDAFQTLQNAHKIENECKQAQEELNQKISILDDLKKMLENEDVQAENLETWYKERNTIQLQELRYKRQSEFRDSQLQQALQRINTQEEQLTKLEKELLKSLNLKEPYKIKHVRDLTKTTSVLEIKPSTPATEEVIRKVVLKSEETQTQFEIPTTTDTEININNIIIHLQHELSSKCNDITARDEMIKQLKLRITELEMSISMFRQQIGDKQSQVTFYEKHILEMQQKHEINHSADEGFIVTESGDGENKIKEIIALKAFAKDLEESVTEKEKIILKYQSLLKKDRDEHSLAAARMQEELKRLQSKLISQEEAYKELKDSPRFEDHPGRAAIEQYILQVHSLEDHTVELHTSVTTLESQLQTSRKEAVRWRSLANDRLNAMEELRSSLEDQHKSELMVYKQDSEKWRVEVNNLQQFINTHKNDIKELRPDIEKKINEKDNKIHDLTITIRQLKNAAKRKPDSLPSTCRDEFEDVKENLIREHEVMKKRFEQVMNREKNAREEIRNLKGQLIKRPILSARSDTTTNKEQNLQKKVILLEKEVDELKEKHERQMALNEAHKIKVNEDFEKWSKQKYWQQTCEKLKVKLKEKFEEHEKLQQTCAGYRILIERLERDKHNYENRFKSLKSTGGVGNMNLLRFEMLELENCKLQTEIETLTSKLDMQQHHSGGLGAAMLQEKLEAQERKIAILELSGKGSGELRSELERLQCTNGNLQKSNLRLEAESLELRLDLEKSFKELPHLREQILHLENYIEVLKSENVEQHEVCSSGDHAVKVPESKKVSELERTVFVLKRIVEKLQVENKRLQGGSRPCTDRSNSADRLGREYIKGKEQYTESLKKVAQLEEELKLFRSGKNSKENLLLLTEELTRIRTQLRQKSELLEKVKVLLHRAAAKEKALLQEVSSLKSLIPSGSTTERQSPTSVEENY